MSKHHFQIGDPDHSTEKTVVIMGVARGGTSMVAGTVREMGIFLGERLGENHEDPQFLPMEVDKIRDIVAERNAAHATWGWKMPHSLQYIEQLEDDLRNPHHILVWRNTLASAVSQVNRSDATIENALEYSSNRLQNMIEKMKLLRGPVLLINYDQAISDKEDFVDTLARFLGVEQTEEMRANCMRFIDPKTGYQQVSKTYYRVEKVDPDAFSKPLKARKVLQRFEMVEETGRMQALGKIPRVVFRVPKGERLPSEFIVRVNNTSGETAPVKLLFDFDWSFSRNLSFKDDAAPGLNAYKVVSNGELIRIAVEPNVTDGISDFIEIECLDTGAAPAPAVISKGKFAKASSFFGNMRTNQIAHVSLKDNYVWFKNAKVASSTLARALNRFQARELPNIQVPAHTGVLSTSHARPFQLSPDQMEELLTNPDTLRFAFVRNPYERLVSGYEDKIVRGVKEKKNILNLMGKPDASLETDISFEAYVRAISSADPQRLDVHWMPQVYCTFSKWVDLHFVGKIENFQDDFLALQQRLGHDLSNYYAHVAPHKTNATDSWRSYYQDAELRALVSEYYAEDFEMFSYSTAID